MFAKEKDMLNVGLSDDEFKDLQTFCPDICFVPSIWLGFEVAYSACTWQYALFDIYYLSCW